MLPYAFSDDASADLDRIDGYLSERNAQAAVRVLASIIATIERACHFPESAPGVDMPGAVAGTRKLVESTYHYVIYYTVVGRTLLVLRIFHGAQQR